MDSGVGTILRQARNRREIELDEVEAATRIRLRYLRAIEHEEWDVLPGGVYTRSFIRTYASFLGLDGERLAEDYRQGVEKWARGRGDRPATARDRPALRPRERRLPAVSLPLLAVLAVVAVAVVAIVAIPAGDGGDGSRPHRPSHDAVTAPKAEAPKPPRRPGVSVRLAASAEVWVCVVDAKGQPLVDGKILPAGADEGPFRSGSFMVSFGNGEVSMRIDGREADIPATSSPIGYAIASSGAIRKLSETERPTCA
jgi:hypothetical protein